MRRRKLFYLFRSDASNKKKCIAREKESGDVWQRVGIFLNYCKFFKDLSAQFHHNKNFSSKAPINCSINKYFASVPTLLFLFTAAKQFPTFKFSLFEWKKFIDAKNVEMLLELSPRSFAAASEVIFHLHMWERNDKFFDTFALGKFPFEFMLNKNGKVFFAFCCCRCVERGNEFIEIVNCWLWSLEKVCLFYVAHFLFNFHNNFLLCLKVHESWDWLSSINMHKGLQDEGSKNIQRARVFKTFKIAESCCAHFDIKREGKGCRYESHLIWENLQLMWADFSLWLYIQFFFRKLP